MNLSVVLPGGAHGDVRCPICPQPPGVPDAYESLLYVEWASWVPLYATKPVDLLKPEDGATTWWKVTCASEHTLVTSADLYEDNDYPPPPTFDDIQAWLWERRPPIIRGHIYRDHNGTCYDCERGRLRHAAAAETREVAAK